jgi:rubrerythrin
VTPSKRFAETTIATVLEDVDIVLNLWTCSECKAEFYFANGISHPDSRPNFCPSCGRRSAEENPHA